MRLVQQIIEKLTLEVGAKIYFLTKIAILSEVKNGYSKVAGVYRFFGWSLIWIRKYHFIDFLGGL